MQSTAIVVDSNWNGIENAGENEQIWLNANDDSNGRIIAIIFDCRILVNGDTVVWNDSFHALILFNMQTHFFLLLNVYYSIISAKRSEEARKKRESNAHICFRVEKRQ